MKKPEIQAVLSVNDVAQAKLLADPLKLRIIQALAEQPRTTMQVAESLGEKPTRLYRHVEALENAGLIQLVASKPKRGTVEKYYQAVARRFELHPELFVPDDDSLDTVLGELLARTQAELHSALRQQRAGGEVDESLAPLFMHFRVRAGAEDIARLRQQLLDWMSQCDATDETAAGEEGQLLDWSGIIAFHPDPQRGDEG